MDAPNTTTIGKDYVTQQQLAQLKDIIDAQVLKDVNANTVFSLSGFGTLGINVGQDTPTSGASIGPLSFTLAGKLAEDPVSDGDILWKLGFSGTSALAATDAYFQWNILSNKQSLNPFFTISLTGGQFKIPFGGDNLAAEDKLPTIKTAQYLGATAFNMGRDVGLKAEGGFQNDTDPPTGFLIPLVGYSVAVLNGSGANATDATNEKDVALRLIYTPVTEYYAALGALKFGYSFYQGNSNYKTKTRIGYDFEYLKKPFLVTGESVGGVETTGVRESGYVLTFFYTPNTLPDFQPLLRVDQYNSNIDQTGKGKTIYTVGFNYFLYQNDPSLALSYDTLPANRVIKIQVNYNIKREETNEINNDEFLAQVVFNF